MLTSFLQGSWKFQVQLSCNKCDSGGLLTLIGSGAKQAQSHIFASDVWSCLNCLDLGSTELVLLE